MRKLNSLCLLVSFLLFVPSLTAQTYSDPNAAFHHQANALLQSSLIETIVAWFNSPIVNKIAWILLISSLVYCLAHLVLMVLINVEAISIEKYNILKELYKDEPIPHKPTTKPVVSTKTKKRPFINQELTFEARIQALENALQTVRFNKDIEDSLSSSMETN